MKSGCSKWFRSEEKRLAGEQESANRSSLVKANSQNKLRPRPSLPSRQGFAFDELQSFISKLKDQLIHCFVLLNSSLCFLRVRPAIWHASFDEALYDDHRDGRRDPGWKCRPKSTFHPNCPPQIYSNFLSPTVA